MRITILGGNGFIGSNLSQHLIKNGFEVISFDKEKPIKQLEGVQYIQGDFFDDNALKNVLVDCDVLFHAISTINPGNSNTDFWRGYSCDFIQSIKLCEWSKEFDFKMIFLSSGGTVYGEQIIFPINEETLPLPINHYGNLKLCIENTIRTFNRQWKLNNIIVRISNPYGPGQDFKKGVGFIDAALKLAINHEKLTIWGDGFNVRDYIYIDDVCTRLSSLINYDGKFEVFNICSNNGTSQNEIIKMIHNIIPDINVEYLPARSVDLRKIVLSNSRINHIYEKEYVGIEEGIRLLYEYLKK